MMCRMTSRLSGLNLSLAGKSHIACGKGCDDYSMTYRLRTVKGRCLLLLSADGVGSCRYASVASKTAVIAAANDIKCALKAGKSPSVSVLRHAFEAAVNGLKEKQKELGEANLEQLGTTLDIAILEEQGKCIIGHCGDGGILLLNRSGQMSSTGKMNTASGAVYTVDWQNPKGEKPWAFHEISGIAAVILATDGLYDYMMGNGALRDAFLKKIRLFADWGERRHKVKRKEIRLKNELAGQTPRNRVTSDDITLVMGCRPHLVSHAAGKAGLI